MKGLKMETCAFYSAPDSSSIVENNKLMVEAAGVEPASEIIVSRENPCSVQFRKFRLMRSERTRCV
jgi:hypothetical protein